MLCFGWFIRLLYRMIHCLPIQIVNSCVVVQVRRLDYNGKWVCDRLSLLRTCPEDRSCPRKIGAAQDFMSRHPLGCPTNVALGRCPSAPQHRQSRVQALPVPQKLSLQEAAHARHWLHHDLRISLQDAAIEIDLSGAQIYNVLMQLVQTASL